MKLLLFLSAPLLAEAYTNGIVDFLSGSFKPKENLKDYSQAFGGTTLDIHLNVADTMGISDLQLRLLQDSNKQQLQMPGYNGPHPSASGGVSSLAIQKPGHFVDLTGLHHLQWGDSASWELTWTRNARAGALICGLELLKPAVRNQAKLQAGRLYLAFPVWTKELLLEAQADKAACEQAVAAILQEKQEALKKFQETDNLLAKAMHYRNAAAAFEKHSMQPIKSMSLVPSNEDVMEIADDVFLTLAGTLWTKQGDGHAFLGGSRKQVLLGTASIAKPPQQEISGASPSVTSKQESSSLHP